MNEIKKSISNLINKTQPRDIIALIVMIICSALKYAGKDGMVSVTMAAIIGYYFSKRVYEEKHK